MSHRALLAAAAVGLVSGLASAQPVNDRCDHALNLALGTTTGTTIDATIDGTASCGLSEVSPDVWYRFVMPARKKLVVSTCDGTFYDTVLSLHDTCPIPESLQFGCNDDACNVQSTVSATLDAGTTVLLRVSGYLGDSGPFQLFTELQEPDPEPEIGPDVIVHDIIDMDNYGSQGAITAFAVGTDACNIGDAPASWYANENRHPVIAQNMYRLKNNRFEQIGLSWLKHGFASTNSPGCGTCVQPPDGGEQLGVGCSDAYGAGLNGFQALLGPRSEVNATTGAYPYPPANPQYAGEIDRRLQVLTADIDPAQNPGARYFVETHYVTRDDAQANNGLNNASYREISIANLTDIPGFVGVTRQQLPALAAWAEIDPSVTIRNLDYVDNGITARFIVASKVIDNQNGTWRYEYAIENLNADRSANSLQIPLPAGVTLTNTTFHDVFYHSQESYSSEDWTFQSPGGVVRWQGAAPTNPLGNALRWGSLYNFGFTADTAPTQAVATLGLYKPGTPDSLSFPVLAPSQGSGTGCLTDFNDDGNSDQDDVAYLVNVIAGGPNPFEHDPDFTHDGNVDQDDIAALLNVIAGGNCP